MKPLRLEDVPCKYGAPMGRPQSLPENKKATGKLQLRRVKMIDGDYDEGGAYWGGGRNVLPLWHAEGDLDGEKFTTRLFVRAGTRAAAKYLIREILPNVRFYR